MLGVDDGELAEVFNTLHPLLLHLRDIILEVERLQDSLMTSLGLGVLLREVLEDIAYAQTVTADFIGISRTDALASGTHLVLSLLSLVGSIEHPMGGHNQMSLLRDM